MPSFNLIFNLDKNLFILFSCWSWCMSHLSSCCFSSQMRKSCMLRDCALKTKRKEGIAEVSAGLIPTKPLLVLTFLTGKYGKEHDILPAIPLFFFSGVAPAPRAGMTHPFHCAGNTEGREEVVHWDQLTANWPFPYCSL